MEFHLEKSFSNARESIGSLHYRWLRSWLLVDNSHRRLIEQAYKWSRDDCRLPKRTDGKDLFKRSSLVPHNASMSAHRVGCICLNRMSEFSVPMLERYKQGLAEHRSVVRVQDSRTIHCNGPIPLSCTDQSPCNGWPSSGRSISYTFRRSPSRSEDVSSRPLLMSLEPDATIRGMCHSTVQHRWPNGST